MQSDKDYYELLGIVPSADAQEIKSAYRNLSFKYHPDRNNESQESNKIMQEINEAYTTLSDPIKRREYDIPRGYCRIVPKFGKGSKVKVSFSYTSPYRDYIGVVDEEPIKDTFRFWYMVKFESNGFVSGSRFAEEELEQVIE
jgi:curved DNA-binding protein CbpA